MKFSELTYTRPDVAALNARCAEFERQAKAADSFEALDAALLGFDAFIEDGFFSDYTLMSINEDEHTDVQAYRDEKRILRDAEAKNLPVRKAVIQAILNNPHAAELEKKYGAYPLRRMREWAFEENRPEAVEALHLRELALGDEFNKIDDEAVTTFEGRRATQHDIGKIKDDPDDARRHAAWRASGALYEQGSREKDRIFDELVHNRDRQARLMGYKNYTDYAYVLKKRDFTRQDAERYRAAVKKYIVPLAEKLMEAQARRVGVTVPFSTADNMPFRDGYPKPCADSARTFREVVSIFREMSPETGEFIDFMTENGFLDVEERPNKRTHGFVTYIARAKAPYLHSHPSGNIADINSFTHEGGHAFAGYMNRNQPISWCRDYPQEVAETHSQAMELFFFPYEERLFGVDAARYRASHLADALTSIAYEAVVDEFQHVVYDNPDLTPEERHGEWRRIFHDYRPWIRLDDDIPFYGNGHFWQRQPHIFLMPFYYIDYSLSQIAAFEFFAEAQRDAKAAWNKYVAFVNKGGTESFVELLQDAGLGSPFEEATIRDIAETIGAWLERNGA